MICLGLRVLGNLACFLLSDISESVVQCQTLIWHCFNFFVHSLFFLFWYSHYTCYICSSPMTLDIFSVFVVLLFQFLKFLLRYPQPKYFFLNHVQSTNKPIAFILHLQCWWFLEFLFSSFLEFPSLASLPSFCMLSNLPIKALR